MQNGWQSHSLDSTRCRVISPIAHPFTLTSCPLSQQLNLPLKYGWFIFRGLLNHSFQRLESDMQSMGKRASSLWCVPLRCSGASRTEHWSCSFYFMSRGRRARVAQPLPNRVTYWRSPTPHNDLD